MYIYVHKFLYIHNMNFIDIYLEKKFLRIVSAKTIIFRKWIMWKFSYTYLPSFRIMAVFYFINWIVAAETIEGRKLFAEIWYL
jgi:hypothetical protein